MSGAPDDLAERPGATGHSAWMLAGILAAIVVGALGVHSYHQVRMSAEQRQATIAATGGDPDRAPALLKRYGCMGCHSVGGSSEPAGQVGPNLTQLARQVYVGGVVTNTPDNLVAFIVDPRSIDPKSAMPRTGISSDQARDIAAYLYAIKQ